MSQERPHSDQDEPTIGVNPDLEQQDTWLTLAGETSLVEQTHKLYDTNNPDQYGLEVRRQAASGATIDDIAQIVKIEQGKVIQYRTDAISALSAKSLVGLFNRIVNQEDEESDDVLLQALSSIRQAGEYDSQLSKTTPSEDVLYGSEEFTNLASELTFEIGERLMDSGFFEDRENLLRVLDKGLSGTALIALAANHSPIFDALVEVSGELTNTALKRAIHKIDEKRKMGGLDIEGEQ